MEEAVFENSGGGDVQAGGAPGPSASVCTAGTEASWSRLLSKLDAMPGLSIGQRGVSPMSPRSFSTKRSRLFRQGEKILGPGLVQNWPARR